MPKVSKSQRKFSPAALLHATTIKILTESWIVYG